LKALVLALALAAIAVPARAAFNPVSPVFTIPSVVVQVKTGDDFFIALPSNVTTGYSWTQTIADAKVLAPEGNVYQNSTSTRAGAGGQQLFVFHAIAAGTTSIAFSYARPFEAGKAPAKSVSFTVTVQ
jgi:inhibitor of cysteine peptidase